MAKRKRLNPAAAFGDPHPDGLETKAHLGWAGVRPTRPPIADVSQDAATHAAFEEVSQELQRARDEGRMIVSLPVAAIEAEHLVRDRLHVDPDEMAVLLDSLRARGQQTPIEVVDLGEGRAGLISGWRRLMALRQLYEETGADRFAHVHAIMRPAYEADVAYQAMVEENEIRANLSFYERAHIVVQATRQGIYPDTQKAVQSLFAAVRAPKRSKILSFTALVEGFDGKLRFPAAIPEKLGLAMAGALAADPGFARRLSEGLRKADPQSPSEERHIIDRALSHKPKTAPPPAKAEQILPGLKLRRTGDQVTLTGAAVDDALIEELRRWLHSRQSNG